MKKQYDWVRSRFIEKLNAGVLCTVPCDTNLHVRGFYIKTSKINDLTDAILFTSEEKKVFYLIDSENHLSSFIKDCLHLKIDIFTIPSFQTYRADFCEVYAVYMYGYKDVAL